MSLHQDHPKGSFNRARETGFTTRANELAVARRKFKRREIAESTLKRAERAFDRQTDELSSRARRENIHFHRRERVRKALLDARSK